MAAFRRMYCTFCRQTFLTASLDQCSLCCKQGGLVDADRPAMPLEVRLPNLDPLVHLPAPILVSRDAESHPAAEYDGGEVTPFPVPPQVAMEELGQPLARFAANALHAWLYFACGAVVLVLALGFFASHFMATSVEGVMGLVTGCSLATGGLGLLWRGRLLLGARLFAFEGGLARIQAGVRETMRWQDVAVVHRGNKPGEDQFTIEHFSITAPRRLSLRDHAGREWVFNEGLSAFTRFRDLVEERTLPSLLLPALEALLAGETLAYGDVGVTLIGLTYPQKTLLDWGSLAQAGIVRGRVVALVKGLEEPYFALPLFEVPNAHVLLGLIEHFRSGSVRM